MSTKDAIAAIRAAKKAGITEFRVELYDRDNDMYGNPNSHMDIWAGGTIIYNSKRRSQLSYGELSVNGEYYLHKAFDASSVLSESGDIFDRKGYSCTYECRDEVES